MIMLLQYLHQHFLKNEAIICIFRYDKDSLPSQFKVHLGQGTEKGSSAKKRKCEVAKTSLEVRQLHKMNRRLTPASKKRTRGGVKSSEGGANSVSLSPSKDSKDKIK